MLSKIPRWQISLHHVLPYEFRRRATATVSASTAASELLSVVQVLCASYKDSNVHSAHHDFSLFDLLFIALLEVIDRQLIHT